MAEGFNTVDECCHKNTATADGGMEGHQYLIDLETPRDYFDQYISCLTNSLEDPTHGYQLVTFETSKENYCLVKYISARQNKMNPSTNYEFYIGLQGQTSDNMKNGFLWQLPMRGQFGYTEDYDANVPTFTNWAINAPNGQDCVKMTTGMGSATSALWTDVDCNSQLFSICERYPLV